MNLTLTLDNYKDIVRRVDSDAITRGGRAMLDYSSMVGLATAKGGTPVRTSVLRGSIQRSLLTDTQAIVETRVKYARYQESGTGIYGEGRGLITPKKGKYLVFKNRSGKVIFARAVRGTKPKWYMRGALQHLESNLDKIFNVGLSTIKQLTGL